MNNRILFAFSSFAAFCMARLPLALAATLEQQAAAVQKAEKGMSLWELIHAGGGVMFFLALLSITLVAFVVYFFRTYRPERLVPEEFARNVLDKLATRKYAQARETCLERENLLSRVVLAALDKQDRGPLAMREAAEMAARTEVSKLWESLSYLSDIAVIAPLVGLLGTVWGMIDSFNVIAFSSASAKPVLLAGGIAKAMVATAGGLVVAIPASVFYSFFRSRVFKITGRVESFTSEVTDLVEGRAVEKGAHV